MLRISTRTARNATLCALSLALTAGCAGVAGDFPPTGAVDPSATVRFAVSVAPTQFDPIATNNEVNDVTYFTAMYDGLTGLDADGRIVPRLAESYEVAPDGLSWTFKIRSGAAFHDGMPIDAAAVVANLERARTAAATNGILKTKLGAVAELSAIDESTVRIRLSAPDTGLPSSLASPALGLVSPAAFEKAGTEPVGSGPYRFESRAADRVAYTRFDEYWDPEVAPAAKLQVSAIPDGQARMNALRSGQIDAAVAQINLSADLDEMDSNPQFQVVEKPTQSVATLYLNTSHFPLDNLDVRRALNYAIDRDAIAQALLGDKCDPTNQPFPNGPGHVEELEDTYSFDPQRSRELLAAAGVENTAIEGIFLSAGLSQTLAAPIQGQLGEVGVTLNLSGMAPAEVRGTFRAGGPDSMVHQINAEPDASATIRNNFLTLDNPGGPSPAIEAAAEAVFRTAIGSEERTTALEDFTRIVVNDPTHIHICAVPNYFVGTSKVVGLNDMPWGSVTLTPDVRTLGITG